MVEAKKIPRLASGFPEVHAMYKSKINIFYS